MSLPAGAGTGSRAWRRARRAGLVGVFTGFGSGLAGFAGCGVPFGDLTGWPAVPARRLADGGGLRLRLVGPSRPASTWPASLRLRAGGDRRSAGAGAVRSCSGVGARARRRSRVAPGWEGSGIVSRCRRPSPRRGQPTVDAGAALAGRRGFGIALAASGVRTPPRRLGLREPDRRGVLVERYGLRDRARARPRHWQRRWREELGSSSERRSPPAPNRRRRSAPGTRSRVADPFRQPVADQAGLARAREAASCRDTGAHRPCCASAADRRTPYHWIVFRLLSIRSTVQGEFPPIDVDHDRAVAGRYAAFGRRARRGSPASAAVGCP